MAVGHSAEDERRHVCGHALPDDRTGVQRVAVESGFRCGRAVGNVTLTFADGNHATFAYTVNAVSQVKHITRQIFSGPGTVCS